MFLLFQIFLVTGGYFTVEDPRDTTELLIGLDAQSWSYGGRLPSARGGLRAATLDNKLLVTGIYLLVAHDETKYCNIINLQRRIRLL